MFLCVSGGKKENGEHNNFFLCVIREAAGMTGPRGRIYSMMLLAEQCASETQSLGCPSQVSFHTAETISIFVYYNYYRYYLLSSIRGACGISSGFPLSAYSTSGLPSPLRIKPQVLLQPTDPARPSPPPSLPLPSLPFSPLLTLLQPHQPPLLFLQHARA